MTANVTAADLYVGRRLLWRHIPRGGYGFAVLLPATVLGVTPKRVRVRVESTGKEVTVPASSLRDPSPNTMRFHDGPMVDRWEANT